jgi:hypothetical protein
MCGRSSAGKASPRAPSSSGTLDPPENSRSAASQVTGPAGRQAVVSGRLQAATAAVTVP